MHNILVPICSLIFFYIKGREYPAIVGLRFQDENHQPSGGGGVQGHAPPGKFGIFDLQRMLLRPSESGLRLLKYIKSGYIWKMRAQPEAPPPPISPPMYMHTQSGRLENQSLGTRLHSNLCMHGHATLLLVTSTYSFKQTLNLTTVPSSIISGVSVQNVYHDASGWCLMQHKAIGSKSRLIIIIYSLFSRLSVASNTHWTPANVIIILNQAYELFSTYLDQSCVMIETH